MADIPRLARVDRPAAPSADSDTRVDVASDDFAQAPMLPAVPAVLVSYERRWDLVTAQAIPIDNKQDAEQELRRALGSGDAQMVQTLSRLAHERGWVDVATIGVDRELLSELSRLEDLASSRGRPNIKQRMFRWRL